MSEISRVALFGKLNSVAYKAVEGATVFCKLRGNPYVELEHWVAQIVQAQDSDWHRIIKHYALDVSVLAKDITAALGTQDYWRMRIGIGHPRTLDLAQPVADFVLHRARKEEQPLIDECIDKGVPDIPLAVEGKMDIATMQLHSA